MLSSIHGVLPATRCTHLLVRGLSSSASSYARIMLGLASAHNHHAIA
jgi:hypothetical protein